MSYTCFMYIHLATVLPAFIIGAFVLLHRKGTPQHRLLGKIFLMLMLITALTTLAMPAQAAPRILNHFGFIHAFSVLTLYNVPAAYFAARRHDIKTHRRNMLGLYIGGLLVAGAFALMPGRQLHHWLFG